MGLVMLPVRSLILKVFAFTCLLAFQGSPGYGLSSSPPAYLPIAPGAEGTFGHIGKAFRSNAPTPTTPDGGVLQPPVGLPPFPSAPVPQRSDVFSPPLPTSAPTGLPPYSSIPIPKISHGTVPSLAPRAPQRKPQDKGNSLVAPEAPGGEPVGSSSTEPPQSPSINHPLVPTMPPSSHQNKAAHPPLLIPITPVADAPAPMRALQHPPPLSEEPPSVAPSPTKLPHYSPVGHPKFPTQPSSSSPGLSPVSTPFPGNSWNGAGIPIAAPPHGNPNQPFNPSPKEAPEHQAKRHSNNVLSPLPSPKSLPRPRFHSPASPPSTYSRHQHSRNKVTFGSPLSYVVPPPASIQGPYVAPVPSHDAGSYPKTSFKHHAPSPLSSVSPLLPPLPSQEKHDFTAPSPSPIAPPDQTRRAFVPPKMSPTHLPIQALPPPPPNEDCTSLTCTEPLTNGPPGSPCVCVLPMQVGLRLSVALYTFFPLVSELAVEIATGVFMKQSQVRIMGANAANQDPEKTIVLIDLVPLGEKFDKTTASLTFERFWNKLVVIKTSLFGGYDVLYVRYPGLPPSPPSAPSSIGVLGGGPYPGNDNNARTIRPIGVDVQRKQHKDGPNGSVIAIIVLSASLAVVLCCAVAWVLFFRHKGGVRTSDQTPATTLHSVAKSSGLAASMIGSGRSSVSLSFGSSFVPYTGSAKTFSSDDIGRATDNFNETRILGEGGFGRVFSGVLEDNTKVAVKILKRDDQQGGREFLAEVEMLSRLHHRNLVKLIGICTEEHTRCLVYELIPNGSVESHLHGIDKETAPLNWSARLKIALGAARGLAYLHEDSSPRVIHRDFKSSNILLEYDFTPKVSDFGLARTAMDEENRHISTRVMGTFGYVAPEYAMTGHLLVKSDVYSYGVVLLELLTGRKPVDMSQPPGQENLVSWARPLLTSKEGLESIVDPSLGPNFPFDSIAKVAAIASMCVQPEVSHRPFMGEVVLALKLVRNECDDAKELGSRSCSQEDISVDLDGRIITNSGHLLDSLRAQSPISNSDSELDVERGISISDLLTSSTGYKRQETGYRRHSSSGPLRTRKARRLWQKMRRLSGGSVSEHGVMFRLWPGSH